MRHEDDSMCSWCGADMEVIGPPGPRHYDECLYASREVEVRERNLTDDEFARLLRQHVPLRRRRRPT